MQNIIIAPVSDTLERVCPVITASISLARTVTVPCNTATGFVGQGGFIFFPDSFSAEYTDDSSQNYGDDIHERSCSDHFFSPPPTTLYGNAADFQYESFKGITYIAQNTNFYGRNSHERLATRRPA